MKKQIALLRGINVGGKNKVPMPELRDVFEEAGFLEVQTYINSGNVIFRSDNEDEEALQEICRQAIYDRFQLDIPLAVLSAEELSDSLKSVPEWWDSGKESKHNAIFTIAPVSAWSVIQIVGEAKPEYEKIAHHGRVIFWSAPLKTFSRTRWSKITATTAYQRITIRNANTAKKLLRLSSDV